MPRIRRKIEDTPRTTSGTLADRLAEELGSKRESGQPVIYEQEFPTGQLRVTVLWDEWDRLPLEDRTAVILRAYFYCIPPSTGDASGQGDRPIVAFRSAKVRGLSRSERRRQGTGYSRTMNWLAKLMIAKESRSPAA